MVGALGTDGRAEDLSEGRAWEALAGPEWLRARRAAAAERAAGRTMPTSASEEWRYSRIDELERSFTPLVPRGEASAGTPSAAESFLAGVGDVLGVVTTCNGRVGEVTLGDVDGIEVTVDSREEDGRSPGDSLLAEVSPDVFADLNEMYSPDPLTMRVTRRFDGAPPLVVVHWVDADGAMVCPRLEVVAEDGSSLDLVEVELSRDCEALVVPRTGVRVGSGASVRHVRLQDLGGRVWRIGGFVADVGEGGELQSAQATLGGIYARSRADCRMTGPSSNARLVAAYLVSSGQMHDFRVFQEHRAPRSTSDLFFSGVIGGGGRAVYTGLVHIGREARGADAFQTNRNLKLGPDAWAESVPNLKIEQNDVRCSHASATGPVDEDALFYLESKGLPPARAKRLIARGFLADAISRFPIAAVAESVRSKIESVLEATLAVEVD
ncbi:MAG: Fe-S cluster assembly protein SufD [Acidimicrobiales bacterium]|nr:MAG: Fe-S cluster assembly protein SufD [Acidimicrobiales bacterium]